MVGEGQVAGVVLHEPGEQPPLIRAQVIPGRHPVRARRVDRAGRDHAQLQLPLVSLLPDHIPARVELAAEPVPPLGRHLMRGMAGPRREVRQHRLVRVDRLGVPQPLNGPVGHVRHEVVALIRAPVRLHRPGVLEQHRIVLVGLPGVEPVEVIEPKAGRPPLERAHHAGQPVRGVVVLPEPRRTVPVLLQDPPDSGGRPGQQRVVARVPGGPLGQETRPAIVMIAAGQQRGAGRPAHRGRMKPVVSQARGRQRVERRSRHRAAERPRLPETDIIQHNDDHIRGPGWRLGRLWPIRHRTLIRPLDRAPERRIRDRQPGTVNTIRHYAARFSHRDCLQVPGKAPKTAHPPVTLRSTRRHSITPSE